MAVPNTGRLLSAWIFLFVFVCFCFWGGVVCFVMAMSCLDVQSVQLKLRKEIVFVHIVIRKSPPKLKSSSRITY